ncbi:EipA family protein [Azospirillum sp. CT11-132]|uniref:EipA family protein n=1 Tax=Azospirillum sp. CT11-132 TaxID=3396317 RepID=UPI0039A654C7
MFKVASHRISYVAMAFISINACFFGELSAQEEKPMPVGRIEFTGGSAALGIGYSWGNGTLYYQGQQFPFSASGLTLADVGGTKNEAAADVYNLKNIEDFPGTYSVAQTGAALVGGGGIGYLENEKGVVLKVTSNTQGARLTLGLGGVTVSMK